MKYKLTALSVLLTVSSMALGHGTEHRPVVTADWQPRTKGPAATGGEWGPVEDWPVLGVHGVVLPTGDVLAWDATPDDFETD